MTDEALRLNASGPIALFDSGIGGLSVLRHVRTLLPTEDLLYVADQAHVPYGPRPAAEVREFAGGITRFCLAHGAKALVVACNTATAAAIHELRATFPSVPFVGMEPAVKPGAATTKTGKVGVLATAGTFESQRYASLMARFAQDVALYENPCHGLVTLIEAGELLTSQTETLIRTCMQPMLEAGVDTVVLGCTHYPFILPTIRSVAGAEVTIIDPAPAVARQLQRVLHEAALLRREDVPGTIQAFTTAGPQSFATLAERLLGYPVPTAGLAWQERELQRLPGPL